MQKFEKIIDDILISTDIDLVNLDFTYENITNSYWAMGIPKETFEKSLINSLCFGVYKKNKQIGFARVISDYSTFAYLGDVFIVNNERGHGYSKILMDVLCGHPELQGLRRFCLGTRDAHTLYEKYGFKVIGQPEYWMEIKSQNIYLEEEA